MVDLFSFLLNHQINKHISWKPDPTSIATDAFQQNWSQMFPDAFPPFSLVGSFNSFQPSRENMEENNSSLYRYDHNYASLGITNLVSSASSINTKPITSTTSSKPVAKPRKGKQPPSEKWNSSSSGMASLRPGMQAEGISERAAAIITKARGEGTRSNYKSAWAKFSCWCNSRQTDPVRCPLNFTLDYLANLFDAQFEYRSINNHRSAISAFHCTIDGFKAGQHPRIRALLIKVCPMNVHPNRGI